jgi:hypothetical protein
LWDWYPLDDAVLADSPIEQPPATKLEDVAVIFVAVVTPTVANLECSEGSITDLIWFLCVVVVFLVPKLNVPFFGKCSRQC